MYGSEDTVSRGFFWGAASRRSTRRSRKDDIVIVDPPTNQRGSFNAEKQYGQVLKRLPELVAPGASIVACLNSPFLNTDFLPGQMARWCPRARLIETMPAAEDFPERYPDRGLKIYRFEFS